VSDPTLTSPTNNRANTFSRGGHFADTIGRLNLLYPMTVLSGLLSLLMWRFALNVGTLTAFVCLYGFCSGVFISVMPAATSQIVPDDKLGAQLGAFSSVTAIAVFVGTPIAGSLIKDGSVPGYMPLVTYSVSAAFLFYS
jgi:MFS family permease